MKNKKDKNKLYAQANIPETAEVRPAETKKTYFLGNIIADKIDQIANEMSDEDIIEYVSKFINKIKK